MGLMEDAAGLFDRGVVAAKGAVSTVACEQQDFMRAFCKMCDEGWQLGYHERNGGNASYRLSQENLNGSRSFFYDVPGAWEPLDFTVPSMAGQYLLITAAGKYLKNVSAAPAANAGIIELDDRGGAWRIVWGFKDGAQPTSEVGAHVVSQGMRLEATGGSNRVVYHAHPSSVAVLTALEAPDARSITRILWKSLTESVAAFPEGVGVVPWSVPGSRELALDTAEALERYAACIWPHHGVLASGATPDEALGLVHAIDKAASVYVAARAAAAPGADIPYCIDDEGLLATAQAYNLPINRSFL